MCMGVGLGFRFAAHNAVWVFSQDLCTHPRQSLRNCCKLSSMHVCTKLVCLLLQAMCVSMPQRMLAAHLLPVQKCTQSMRTPHTWGTACPLILPAQPGQRCTQLLAILRSAPSSPLSCPVSAGACHMCCVSVSCPAFVNPAAGLNLPLLLAVSCVYFLLYLWL